MSANNNLLRQNSIETESLSSDKLSEQEIQNTVAAKTNNLDFQQLSNDGVFNIDGFIVEMYDTDNMQIILHLNKKPDGTREIQLYTEQF